MRTLLFILIFFSTLNLFAEWHNYTVFGVSHTKVNSLQASVGNVFIGDIIYESNLSSESGNGFSLGWGFEKKMQKWRINFGLQTDQQKTTIKILDEFKKAKISHEVIYFSVPIGVKYFPLKESKYYLGFKFVASYLLLKNSQDTMGLFNNGLPYDFSNYVSSGTLSLGKEFIKSGLNLELAYSNVFEGLTGRAESFYLSLGLVI